MSNEPNLGAVIGFPLNDPNIVFAGTQPLPHILPVHNQRARDSDPSKRIVTQA